MRRSPRRQRPYDTDPPSSASSRMPVDPPIYDLQRYSEAIRRGLIDGVPPLPHPNDDLLVATVMSLGMPRRSAEQMRGNPMVRKFYLGLWCDVKAAAQGDKPAKQRIDAVREDFELRRRDELISDLPGRTVWSKGEAVGFGGYPK